jgi:hypothetical protein
MVGSSAFWAGAVAAAASRSSKAASPRGVGRKWVKDSRGEPILMVEIIGDILLLSAFEESWANRIFALHEIARRKWKFTG